MSDTSQDPVPRWSLDSVFPGFDSTLFTDTKKRLTLLAEEISLHLASVPADTSLFDAWLLRALGLENESAVVSGTLGSYCSAVYTVNTADTRALAEINAVEELCVPFSRLSVLFRNLLAARRNKVLSAVRNNALLAPYAFYFEESLFLQTRQMSEQEEDLASDLARSGADAWGRLQEQLTSSAEIVWDESTGETKTLTALRSLAFDPDRSVRRKAFEKETALCKSIEMSVAACINGVKGSSLTLNRRRNWNGALDQSLAQGRISRKALSSLISAMEQSLPHWRRYLAAKARLLGLERCAFYDLFAPVGNSVSEYGWKELEQTIIRTFSSFSPSLGNFAKKAFDNSWIDAEMRPGKIGGAYCTDMAMVKETRVMCNFDRSFSSLTTVAHELGHAFHAEVLKDQPPLLQSYPMTLAETASIFAETIVFHEELEKADEGGRLSLLEMHLQDGCQILVDILSRYYFEQSVMDARANADLSASQLCALMRDAQMKTYGEGLAADGYHPWMWVVKPHYYFSSLDFYNFPYAFGQLFAFALFARYKKEGPSFARTYEEILLDTGRMNAVELTRRAGFDIERAEFWQTGIDVFISTIDEFERLVDARQEK